MMANKTTAAIGAQLVKSINNGLSWTLLNTTPHFSASYIIAIDENIIIYVGCGGAGMSSGVGEIRRSVDGGINFSMVYRGVAGSGVNPYPSAPLLYLGDGIVILCNTGYWGYEESYNKVLRSVDYGVTWNYFTSVSCTIRGSVSSAVHLGNGIVLMCGIYGILYRSIDYGVDWNIVYGDIFSTSVNSLCDFGNGIVVAIADNYYPIRSVDYGETWSRGAYDLINYSNRSTVFIDK